MYTQMLVLAKKEKGETIQELVNAGYAADSFESSDNKELSQAFFTVSSPRVKKDLTRIGKAAVANHSGAEISAWLFDEVSCDVVKMTFESGKVNCVRLSDIICV